MKTILLVDDTSAMRQMISFTLKEAGFNVIEAVDGQDAWEKSRAADFSLALAALSMPRMDGLSLTRKLRSDLKFQPTPILIMTAAELDGATRLAGRSAGVTDWVVKPSTPAALMEAVMRVIPEAAVPPVVPIHKNSRE